VKNCEYCEISYFEYMMICEIYSSYSHAFTAIFTKIWWTSYDIHGIFTNKVKFGEVIYQIREAGLGLEVVF